LRIMRGNRNAVGLRHSCNPPHLAQPPTMCDIRLNDTYRSLFQ
jgi:hypothetical protein